MPEGPEIWILSKAINHYYDEEHKHKHNDFKTTTFAYGKHLFVMHNSLHYEDWSFQLTGKVQIVRSLNKYNKYIHKLVKINSGWLSGDVKPFQNLTDETKKLGINWMTAEEPLIREEVNKWINSKKKLANIILDQSKISGIGVAWGSEILFKSNLRPDMRTCDQYLVDLADNIIYFRNKIQKIYLELLTKINKQSELQNFINEWFDNLYEVREMQIYKKGSKLEVSGRNWWV